MAYKVFTNGSVLNASEVNDNLMNQAVITFTNSTARASAITSPVEGMVTYLADTDTYQFWNGTAWTNLVSSTVGSGNAIINGAFDFWQRGTSNAGGYLADRWFFYGDETGATYTQSRQTFTPGAAPVAGVEGQFFYRINKTTGTGGAENLVFQRIEDVRTFAGQQVTVSFYAKADAARNVILDIDQNFGTGGSATVDVQTTLAATTSWQRFSFTTTLPSISGKTIGSNSFLQVKFTFPLNAAFTFDIWGVQVEAGSTATPFRRNANSLQGELAACQRYYYRVNAVANGFAPIALGYAMSTTSLNIFVQPASQMRTTPTSVEFSTLRVSGPSNSQVVSAVAISSESNANVIKLDITSSGLTSSANYHLSANNSTAGFLGLSAEL